MPPPFDVDWDHLLLPSTPLAEIMIRGTVIYLSLFLILRLVLKREAGGLSITNLLVVVLLADAVQNGMADDYHSLPDALVLVVTIVFWSYTLDWLGYHFPRLQRFVHPPPLQLIQNGEFMWRNMRHELITREELLEILRQQGVSDVKKVKAAFIEGSGKISVIQHEEQHNPNGNRETPV